MANTFGHLFRITTWGESHGGGVGVVVEGALKGGVRLRRRALALRLLLYLAFVLALLALRG